MKSVIRVLVGLAMLWGALAVYGYRTGWQLHTSHGRTALLGSTRLASSQPGSCTAGVPVVDGQLAGVLSIAKLGVTAPVESGTDDAELNVAVGHADGTPWPGSSGSSVLLAHDVSYFADLARLSLGDTFEYRQGCITRDFVVTGHEVVKAGDPIAPMAGNGVVLDTCWPTNALWYTPDRYLVEATERSVTTDQGSSPAPVTTPVASVGQYTTPAPTDLLATGIDLGHNEEPMGKMTLAGDPSPAWAQSPGPLEVAAAALQGYFGALHGAEQDRTDWWSAMAPGVAMDPVLARTELSGWGATPLDVTITAEGGTPTSVRLETVMPLAGPGGTGRYHMVITEAVQGSTIVVTNWEVDHCLTRPTASSRSRRPRTPEGPAASGGSVGGEPSPGAQPASLWGRSWAGSSRGSPCSSHPRRRPPPGPRWPQPRELRRPVPR